MRHSLCATALLALAPAALAGGAEQDWPALDRELAALSASLEEGPHGPRLWGYVRTNFAWSDEFRNAAGESLGGVFLDNVRLALDGRVEGFAYRVSGDMQSGTMQLQDAWVEAELGEEIRGTLGQFKTPFLRNGLVEARDLLFITRSRSGVFASVRDRGAMVHGDHGRLHWAVAAQNGADDVADEMRASGRISVDVVGDPLPAWEGAFSAGDEARVNLAVAYTNDNAADDGTAIAVEATAIVHRIYLHAELVDYDDDWTLDPNFPGEQFGGTTPWALVASWMPYEGWELAARYDDYDDVNAPQDFDRRQFTFGVNRYIAGHDVKWQLNYAYGDNSGADDGTDSNLFALGLTLAF